MRACSSMEERPACQAGDPGVLPTLVEGLCNSIGGQSNLGWFTIPQLYPILTRFTSTVSW